MKRISLFARDSRDLREKRDRQRSSEFWVLSCELEADKKGETEESSKFSELQTQNFELRTQNFEWRTFCSSRSQFPNDVRGGRHETHSHIPWWNSL